MLIKATDNRAHIDHADRFRLKKLTNDLGSIKGVLRCKLTMAAKKSGHMHYIGPRND